MINSAHVIGMGRLGRPLANRLEEMGIPVHRWSRRASEGVTPLSAWPSRQTGDAVFLAVPDDAISEVADQLAPTLPSSTLWVHHAGAVALDILPAEDQCCAVMWPPMTFGEGQPPDWSTLPMGVETDHEPLFQWATKLAPQAFRVTATSRPQLHLGAVLSGNLTAAWIGAVEGYLESLDLPMSSLRPLIEESVRKALKGRALDTVSGPASRNDRATLDLQVQALHTEVETSTERSKLSELHRLLTNLILEHHGHPTLPPFQAETGTH